MAERLRRTSPPRESNSGIARAAVIAGLTGGSILGFLYGFLTFAVPGMVTDHENTVAYVLEFSFVIGIVGMLAGSVCGLAAGAAAALGASSLDTDDVRITWSAISLPGAVVGGLSAFVAGDVIGGSWPWGIGPAVVAVTASLLGYAALIRRHSRRSSPAMPRDAT